MSDTSPLLPIGPLLPTAVTLVHFYLQVWHQSTFTHRSDTSPLYPQVWHLKGRDRKYQAFATFAAEIFAYVARKAKIWTVGTAIVIPMSR